MLIEMTVYVDETTYFRVIIERKYSEEEIYCLHKRICNLFNLHGGEYMKITYIAQKIPWKTLKVYRNVSLVGGFLSVPTAKEYLTLAYDDWRRYIPIPRILKKITPKVEFYEDRFTMVDFV